MRNFYGSFGNTRPANKTWRDELKELQDLRKELSTYGELMAPYDRLLAENDIKARSEQLHGLIAGGVLSHHEEKIKGFQDAQSNLDKQRAREIARWKVSELRDAVALTRDLVSGALSTGQGDPLTRSPGAAERLQAIYQEAKDSGDPVKQRAVYEIFQTINPHGDTGVNHLVEQSKKDLRELRTTPEVIQARETVSQSWEKLQAAREEVREVAQVLGEGDPAGPFAGGDQFSMALKRVQVERETGKVRIFSPTDPEVTGVDFSKLETHGG